MASAEAEPDDGELDPGEEAILVLVDALARGDHQRAASVADQALEAARVRPALLLRVHGYRGQLHLALGDHDQAKVELDAALALAQATDDPEAIAALAPLRLRAMTATSVAVRKPSLAPLKAPKSTLERALAAFDRNDLAEGEALAVAAFEDGKARADDRDQVMALLALARVVTHRSEALDDAAAIADASSDRNLVTAVVQARKGYGMAVPKQVF